MSKVMSKGKIKILMIAILIIGVSLIGILLASQSLIKSEMNATVENIEDIDVMIVLGAGLWGDKVSPQLRLRLDTAMELIEKNNEITIIVSGGQGEDELISEAEAMKKYLVNKGANSNNIYTEDKSVSTSENIAFSKKILDEMKFDNPEVVLVTTDFHVYRAKMLAKSMGLDIRGQAAPNIESIRKKNMNRERLALVKDIVLNISN